MKTGSKFVTVLLWILVVFATVAMVGGGGYYLYGQLKEDDGEKNRPSHEIVVNENIEVLLDRAQNISPEIIDGAGNPVLGKFRYEYEEFEEYIHITDGVISVLKPYDGEIKVTIKEENTGLEKTVAVKIVTVLSDVLKIQKIDEGETGEVAEDLSDDSLTALTVGESYVFEVITMPTQAAVEEYFTLTATDGAGEAKKVFETSVSKNRITLTAVGVGSGEVNFALKNAERGLDYALKLPFTVSFEDEAFNEAVLKNGDGLLSDTEIASIQTLVFDDEVDKIESADWDRLTSLKKVVFELFSWSVTNPPNVEPPVVQVTNLEMIGENVVFRVNGLDVYKEYVASQAWAGRIENVYPYIDDPEKAVVVYHNEGVYALSGKIWEKNALYELETETEFDFVTGDEQMLNADNVEEGYSVRELTHEGYTFAGWKDGEGASFTDEDLSAIKEGIHVYAGWTANEYEVTLDGLYADGTQNKNVTVTYDQGLPVLSEGVKAGWSFEGWYLSDEYKESEKIEEGFIYRVEGDKTLYAKYSATVQLSYTVKADGENISSFPIVYGKTPDALPASVTASEWTFGGWYESEEYLDDGKVTATEAYIREGKEEDGFSHTLYSKFTYPMAFDVLDISDTEIDDLLMYGGLTIEESLKVERKGRTWDSIVPKAKDGWTFAGWTAETYYREENRVGFLGSGLDRELITDGQDDCTLNRTVVYAIYEAEDTYLYGTNGEKSFTQTVVYGCKTYLPYTDEEINELVFVEGYTFARWYADDSAAENNLFIGLPQTYTAKYNAEEYLVTFLSEDGATVKTEKYFDVGTNAADNVLNNDEEGLTGRTVVLGETPLKTGYTGYWAYGEENVGVENWTVLADVFENITLKAKYKANEYQVSFDTHGVGTVADRTVTYAEKYGTLPTPTKPTGFETFVGWFTDKNYTTEVKEDTVYKTDGNTTLFAKYETNVTLHLFKDTDTQTAVYAFPYTFDDLADPDGRWTFAGWYYLDGEEEVPVSSVVESFTSSVKDYYSRWVRPIELVAGESFETVSTITVEREKSIEGSGVALPTDGEIEKTGDAVNWELSRWYYMADGVKTTAAENDIALVKNTDIKVLYAEYTSTVTVRIEYKSADGNLATVQTLGYSVTLGEELFTGANGLNSTYADELKADEPYGFYFNGWTVGEDTTVYTEGSALLAFAKQTVYAQFDAAKYTLTYEAGAQDAILTGDDKVVAYCDEAFALATAPTRTGYTFTGWKIGKDTYEAGATVVNLSYKNGDDVTATAVWQANTYTLRYDLNGGAGEIEPYEATYDGDPFALAGKPTREGYEFDKWVLNGKEYEAGATVVNLSYENGKEVTATAKWTANRYTVVYDEAGGSEVDDTPAVYDTEFTLGAASEQNGYTFGGWEIEGKIYQAGATIRENLTAKNGATITATAIWEAIVYKIVYLDESDNEVGVSEYTYTIESKSYPQPAVPEKIGYTGKWDTSGLVTGETFGDQTVYAVYTPLSYTVTYYAGETQIKRVSYTIEQHDGMDDSQAPTVDDLEAKYPNKGYEFIDWIKDGWTDWKDWTITNKKVYATYGAIEYTLNFVDEEKTSYGTATFTADDLAVATPSAPVVLGYEIDWELTREGLLAAIEALGEDERTIEVTCKEKTAIVYKAMVKAGGESYVYHPYTVESLVENKLTLFVPETEEGYAYVVYGATIEEGEKGGKLVLAISTLGDLVIEEKSSEYEYTFLLVFEGCDEELTTVVGNGESVLLPTPTKVGYAFAGWQYKGLTLVGVEELAIEASANETVTLTALWTAIEYTVSFENCEDVTDQTVVAEISAAYDEEISLPAPQRIGYLFAGWTVGDKIYAAGERVSGLTSEDGGVVTATANWTAIEYNVSYNANGGDQTPANHTATYGEWFKLPSYINKEGYLFAGWSVEGAEEPFDSGERVKDLAFEQGATVVLIANWKAITYTVVFDNSDIEDMVCEYGVEYAYPNNPIHENHSYSFHSWSYYKDGKWEEVLSTKTSTEKIYNYAVEDGAVFVLVAQWSNRTETEYTLTFDTKGLVYVPSKTVEFGEEVELPEIEKEGYIFNGWILDEKLYEVGDKFVNNNSEEKNVQLTAVWKTIEYTITFEGVTYTTTYTVETARGDISYPTEYAALEKTGYLCTWILPETLIGDIYAPLERKPISFTLTFALDDGTGDFADKTVYYETAIVLGEPTKEGFLFAGWKADNGSVYSGTETLVAKFTATDGDTVRLTALWTKAIATYTATFVANGVEVATIEFTEEQFGKRLLAPAVPERAENGTHYTGVWESYTLQASDLTIEAVYTPKAYKVEYYYQIKDTDDKTVIHTAFYTVEEPLLALPSAPAVEGYLFVAFEEVQLDGGDKQVKAVYAPVTYTVSFDSDGGSEVESFEAVYDQAFTLDQTPTKAGHTFAGWKLDEAVYSTSEELKNLCPENGGSVLFKAVWSVNSYTLAYDLAGGSLDGELSATIEYQANFTLLSAPTKKGYAFVGWSIDGQTEEAEKGLVYAYASDMTAKAVWELVKYTVIFVVNPDDEGQNIEKIWTVETGALIEPSTGGTESAWKKKDGDVYEDYVLNVEAFDENGELRLYLEPMSKGAYKIEFRLNDETLIATRYYTVGDTVTIPVVPTKTGYLGTWDISGISSEYFTYQDGKITVEKGATGNVTIYATYEPIAYTVSYLVDGEETASMELKYDESFAHIDDPSKLGYVFGGWALDGEKYEGDLVDLCQNDGGRVEFNAIFTPIEYTVVYHSNGGDLTPENVTAIYDQAFTLPEGAGVCADKEFVGWKLEGSETVYAAGEATINLTTSAGTVHMYAQWSAVAHTATFVDENGLVVGTAIFRDGKFEENSDGETSLPTVPEKEHYTGEWDIPTLGASDVTVYADYTPVRYAVTFVVGGETVGSAFYTVVSEPAFPVLTKEHYTLVWSDTAFDGGDKTVTGEYEAIEYTLTFYKTEGGEEVLDEVVYTVDRTNVTLPAVPSDYAAWDMPVLDGGDKSVYPIATVEEGYIVTFVDSAKKAITSIVLNEGETLTEALCPAVPERQGYTGVWILSETLNGDVTIEPKYTPIEYTVTFVDENGEKVGEPATYTVQNDNIDVPAVPEKEHYTGEWALPELTYGDVTVYPVYVPIVYTVTFYDMRGEIVTTRVYTIENKTISVPEVPDETGYLNKQWSAYDLNDLTDITVKAEYAASTYNIEYVIEGCLEPTDPQTPEKQEGVLYDHNVTIRPYVVPVGYKAADTTTGVNWVDQNGNLYTSGAEYKNLTAEDGDTVVLTMYLTPIKYRVVYPVNETTHIGVTVTYDKDFEMPGMLHQTGYVYDNYWYASNGEKYYAGAKYSNLTAVDGEEIWLEYKRSLINYTVKFYDRHGNYIDEIFATYGQTYTTLAAPVEEGYTFTGWKYWTSYTIDEKTTFKNLTAILGQEIEMYATATINTWNMVISESDGAWVEVVVSGKGTFTASKTVYDIPYGTSFTISYGKNDGYKNASCSCSCGHSSMGGTHYMPDSDITISTSADKDGVCLVVGTLITLADGSQKKVEDLTSNDELLVFNHETGKLGTAKFAFNAFAEKPATLLNVLNLKFSDGTIVRMADKHGFFDVTLNEYVYLTNDNVSAYIGHEFYTTTFDGMGFVGGTIVLVDAYITSEYTRAISPITVGHLNCFAENVLSVTAFPYDIEGFVNIFEYDENMKYDEEAKAADIATYGLFTYEEFADKIPYEIFEAFNVDYLKVSVAKGYITVDEMETLINFLKEQGVI